MTGRFLFVCGAWLVLANIALGDGTYQFTKSGKTLVWNNDPKPGDQATWSGDRDRDGYARGFGTLTWYTKESETSSAKPAVYARYWGNMVRGKLNGPVNVHSKRKTAHAIFADGVRMTRWTSGPASLKAAAQWRAVAARRSPVREPEAPAEGPVHAPTESAERPITETQKEVPAEGPLVAKADSAQLSTNASMAPTGSPETDVDDSLRLLAWPPPSLGMRSLSKGSLARARARLTKEEVVDLADAAARSRGYDPTEYQRSEPQYDLSAQAWSLLYEEKPAERSGDIGKHVSVAVGDKTKRTALVPGK